MNNELPELSRESDALLKTWHEATAITQLVIHNIQTDIDRPLSLDELQTVSKSIRVHLDIAMLATCKAINNGELEYDASDTLLIELLHDQNILVKVVNLFMVVYSEHSNDPAYEHTATDSINAINHIVEEMHQC